MIENKNLEAVKTKTSYLVRFRVKKS